MVNMIRTELYRVRTYKRFRKHLLIFTVLSFAIVALVLAFFEKLMSLAEPGTNEPKNVIVTVSEALREPFWMPLLMVFMFISAVSFFYMDFANGYVKNIAGQVKSKDSYVVAKLLAVAVMNLIYFICGSLTYLLAAVITGHFEVGTDIAGGVLTFLIKWLLSIALCSILMFFSVGIKNHTVSVIIGVVFSTNTLSLIYTGVNYGIHELFKVKDFDISHYSPSSLFGTVNAVTGKFVVNALIVSAVFIAAFVCLTCATFKKRDIH